MSISSSSSVPKKSPSSSSGIVKIFGFSVPRDDGQHRKVNDRSMTMKSNKKKMLMTMININQSQSSSSSSSSSSFKCEYCGQGFATSQALSGHQNAHKAERRLTKLNPLHHPNNNYFLTATNVTYFGAGAQRFIGVRPPPSMAAPTARATPAISRCMINKVSDYEEDREDIDLELRL